MSGASGAIGFGIRGGMCFIESDGGDGTTTEKASMILAPISAYVALTSNTGGFIDVALGVSGGVSILAVTREDNGTQSKTLPYAGADISVFLRITNAVGISAAIEIMAFFEKQYPVFGYAPSVTIVF